MKKLLIPTLAAGLVFSASIQARWSGQFGQAPEDAITTFAATNSGFVAAGNPLEVINDAGVTEFHVLRFYENGQWRTTGDIGTGVVPSGPITTVAPYRNDVCVGGGFTNFSPGGFNYLACLNTASGQWYQPGGNGNGPNMPVNSIWFDGSVNIYIGGDFNQVLDDQGMPITANRVARTTGALWEPLTGDGGATNGVAAPVKVVRTFQGFVFVLSNNQAFRYNPTNTTWTPFGAATANGGVSQVLDDLDFFSGEVIASGPFDTIGGVIAPGVATSQVATGPDWMPLDDGSQGHGSGEPLMAASSSYIYVTGPWPDLTGADGLARWTGTVWEAVDTSALGSNVATTLQDVAIQPASEICIRHQGLTGSELASRGVACKPEPVGAWRGASQGIEGTPQALAWFMGELLAAGNFLTAGDDALASNIARWTGSRWTRLGMGVGGTVDSLAVFQGELFAAGNISSAGGGATGGLVAWDGIAWRDAGGPGTTASLLYALSDSLYFFGTGGNCGGSLSSVCRFDGASIEEAASGLPAPVSVSAIGEYNGQLVVAGNFSFTGGGRQDVIASLDAGAWSVLVSFTSGGGVDALTHDGADLYFGGSFTSNVVGASGSLNGVARFDGSQITALGSGVAGGLITRVQDIELFEGQVVVTGDFTAAGGATARGIARWDGVAWDGLQGGLLDVPFPGTGSGNPGAGTGQALLTTPQGLFVGGTFDRSGDEWAGNIGLFTGDTVFSNGFEAP